MAKKKDSGAAARIVARNRRAHHDYRIELTVEAGIVLQGTEVKSLRQGQVNLEQAYARIEHGEVWLVGANFPEYSSGGWTNHRPQARRKLLLHRREIGKLEALLQGTGRTLIPLDIHWSDRGQAKLLLAVAIGKKIYDKREAAKERTARIEMDRASRRRS